MIFRPVDSLVSNQVSTNVLVSVPGFRPVVTFSASLVESLVFGPVFV
jgi:hypothetical protein